MRSESPIWAASPRVADVEDADGTLLTLRVEPRLGAGPPIAVVLAGPWTPAALDAVRRADPRDTTVLRVESGTDDADDPDGSPGARRPLRPGTMALRVARAVPGRAGTWTVERPGHADEAAGDYAVFQLCAPTDDADAPPAASLVAPVAAAIREATEGWTPPLVRLEPSTPPAPRPRLELFAFSCQYPPGLVEGPVAYGSMHRLARSLAEPPGPGLERWTVSMGDLVYVDATAGLFEPTSMSERFDGPWERLRESSEWRAMRTAAGARFAALADDHELDENWEPNAEDATRAVVRARGVAAFARHLGAAAPTVDGGRGPVLRTDGGPSIFLADTRLGRDRRRLATLDDASILDASRWTALCDWLVARQRAEPWRPKFVVCPALLLPRRLSSTVDAPASALRSDAWDGFPGSLRRFFRLLLDEGIRNVVVVSGDEHFSMTARATLEAPGRAPVSVFSVHCSSMHAPYPFANGRIEDFASDGDAFVLPYGASGDAPGAVRCTVDPVRVAGLREGFARLRERRDGDAWAVEIDWFDGRNYRDAEARFLEAPARDDDGSHAARMAARRRACDDREVLALDRPPRSAEPEAPAEPPSGPPSTRASRSA